MVIREQNDHRLLITQPAHAWISGQIAENWGCYGFIRSEPWKGLCFAAAHHDDGWINHDIRPKLNPDHFKKKQHALQEIWISDLEKDGFYWNVIHDQNLEQHRLLLSAFDYLSLFLILGKSQETKLNNISSFENHSNTVFISEKREDSETCSHSITYTVSPWPFVNDHVQLRCDAIYLKKPCADQEELNRVMKQNERLLFTVKLTPG